MTAETDLRTRLIHEHFETIRQLDVDEAQAKADAAAAAGDEWRREFHQREADRARSFRFAWETEQSTP